jgi:hypothetical protein
MGFSRSYGWDETVHAGGEVNVELDSKGNVVAVWFRCTPLAFTQSTADKARAEDMRRMYEHGSIPKITALALED